MDSSNYFTNNTRHITSVMIFSLWYFQCLSLGKSSGMLICCFSDLLHMYHIIITSHMLPFSCCHSDNGVNEQFISRPDIWNKVLTSKGNRTGNRYFLNHSKTSFLTEAQLSSYVLCWVIFKWHIHNNDSEMIYGMTTGLAFLSSFSQIFLKTQISLWLIMGICITRIFLAHIIIFPFVGYLFHPSNLAKKCLHLDAT